jgi:hypothetical protein
MIAAGRDIRIGTRDAPWLPLLVGLVLVASVGGLVWAAGGGRRSSPRRGACASADGAGHHLGGQRVWRQHHCAGRE